MQSRISVVVVDDHPLYREGVVHCFQSSEKFEVLGEGASASDAIELVSSTEPDLLLLDIQLPGGGLEAAKAILATPGSTRIMVLSVEEDITCVVRAFQIGVCGYLLKGISGSELVKIAEAAAAGETCVAPQLVGHLLKHVSGRSAPQTDLEAIEFSVREEQTLALLAQGMSNKVIAHELGISEKTVKYYLTNLMKKLHFKNRVEVALYAAQQTFRSAEVRY